MSKSAFTAQELKVWNSIYGPSRGPTPGHLRILVEELASRGLYPTMMKIRTLCLPYEEKALKDALLESFMDKDDDRVQVYYHPAECVKVIGSSTSAWTQWARRILEVNGLVPESASDIHPALDENMPRIGLPTVIREQLRNRGVIVTASLTRLLSLRMVVFFIAAQYGAWASPSEVAQVTPFKEMIRRQGYEVRSVEVRKDSGLDEALEDLETAACIRVFSNKSVFQQLIELGKEDVASAQDELDANIMDALRATSTVQEDPVLQTRSVDEEIAETQSQIRAAEERLETLRVRKKTEEREALKTSFLSASVTGITFTNRGAPDILDIELPNGESYSFRYLL